MDNCNVSGKAGEDQLKSVAGRAKSARSKAGRYAS